MFNKQSKKTHGLHPPHKAAGSSVCLKCFRWTLSGLFRIAPLCLFSRRTPFSSFSSVTAVVVGEGDQAARRPERCMRTDIFSLGSLRASTSGDSGTYGSETMYVVVVAIIRRAEVVGSRSRSAGDLSENMGRDWEGGRGGGLN